MRGATDAEILEWSCGQVTKPETLNYRTLKPEHDGLSCSRIFGPVEDFRCLCEVDGELDVGSRCEKCGVEISRASVRGERFGHIVFPWPIVHPLFHGEGRGGLARLIDVPPDDVEKIISFDTHVVTRSDDEQIAVGTLFDEDELNVALSDSFYAFEHETGGRCIAALLEGRGEGLLMQAIPVLPPELRPMTRLDDGTFRSHGTTDLYRRVVNRSNRLKRLIELNATELILRCEGRMLQTAVDALFDNGFHRDATLGPDRIALPCLRALFERTHGLLPKDVATASLPDAPLVSALALVS